MKLKQRLKAMEKDERMAPGDYLKIRHQLTKQRDKKIVDGIIKQERSHLRKVKSIIKREIKR